ncbi:hypothetical protein SCG7086_AH_00030 [Chlamydiales bacterium SCGC AG-110-P3]|nr:hypothetical protein SCG7086_AH_00030 [Chlamydiales bacterium SCGC AG-110-P3]
MKVFRTDENLIIGGENRITEGYIAKSAQCSIVEQATGGGISKMILPAATSDGLTGTVGGFLLDQAIGSLVFNAQSIGNLVEEMRRKMLLSDDFNDTLNLSSFLDSDMIESIANVLKSTGVLEVDDNRDIVDLTGDLIAISFGKYVDFIDRKVRFSESGKRFFIEFDKWYDQKSNIQSESEFLNAKNDLESTLLSSLVEEFNMPLTCSKKVIREIFGGNRKVMSWLRVNGKQLCNNDSVNIVNMMNVLRIPATDMFDMVAKLIQKKEEGDLFLRVNMDLFLSSLKSIQINSVGVEIYGDKERSLVRDVFCSCYKSFIVFSALSILFKRVTPEMCNRKGIKEAKNAAIGLLSDLYFRESAEKGRLVSQALKASSKKVGRFVAAGF